MKRNGRPSVSIIPDFCCCGVAASSFRIRRSIIQHPLPANKRILPGHRLPRRNCFHCPPASHPSLLPHYHPQNNDNKIVILWLYILYCTVKYRTIQYRFTVRVLLILSLNKEKCILRHKIRNCMLTLNVMRTMRVICQAAGRAKLKNLEKFNAGQKSQVEISEAIRFDLLQMILVAYLSSTVSV